MIGERERANLVLGLDDFSIFICTGIALRNLIGRFKHAQRANVRPAQTRDSKHETERTSLPISGNDMTSPYQEKARDQESEEALEQRLARVKARRRQRLALQSAEERQTRLSRRRVRLTGPTQC